MSKTTTDANGNDLLGPCYFAGALLGNARRHDEETGFAILTDNDEDFYVVAVGETELYSIQRNMRANLNMAGARAVSYRYSRKRANAVWLKAVREEQALYGF